MDRGQIVFFGAAALFLAYEAFRGWRLGVVRQGVRLAGLGVAYLAAFLVGGAALPLLRLSGYPDFVLRPVSMALVAFAVYGVIVFIGGVLFRKTTDQESRIIRFAYGTSGALLGVLAGLVFVLMAAVALRFLGTLATGAIRPGAGEGETPARGAAISGLVEMKNSLEKGIPGALLESVDPVPEKMYGVVGKIGRVSASPEAIHRFLDFPGARELARQPEIVALREDPAIAQALREGRFLPLLRNPHVVKAANSAKVSELARKFELTKALDYALEAEKPPEPPKERRPGR